MTTKTALVLIATGSEEIETVAIVDTLVRASVQVTLASVEQTHVTKAIECSRGVKIVPDAHINELPQDCLFDVIVVPGGMPGAEIIASNSKVLKMLERHALEQKIIAAICAAPAVVLGKTSILTNKQATCHPAFMAQLVCKEKMTQRVVIDGNVITSRAPGTAIEFTLAIIEKILGKEKANRVAEPMLV
ncbi:DJ-1 family protein [Saccharobesus litoralis]|uniref:DJ-1 family protein n=1 Tax=Saccharobesus litoralis TaxID=2172099 RepID=A0A2S0VU36_9ALTE|nr:DJ-1 family glyoxalase III [Saccharobesus litoralis]AWB67682.1 DJ-1 family protein [Saccharobesus litoralis]